MILTSESIYATMHDAAERLNDLNVTGINLHKIVSVCASHEKLRDLCRELLGEIITIGSENKDLLDKAKGVLSEEKSI